jgi:hypothetical protein
MANAIIPTDFALLAAKYQPYWDLSPEVKKVMSTLSGTPCCVQVSDALNKVGQLVGPKSRRRDNACLKIDGTKYFYLMAVDEDENYLNDNYGQGDEIRRSGDGSLRSESDMKDYLNGTPGIIAFRSPPGPDWAGLHVELWDGSHILQSARIAGAPGRGMNEPNLFRQPRVVFWTVGIFPPSAPPDTYP